MAAGVRAAAVISSYAKPLLEGCGTVKKGDLRVIGETKPIPFITAFVADALPAAERDRVSQALLAAGTKPELCKALETLLDEAGRYGAGPVESVCAVSVDRVAPNRAGTRFHWRGQLGTGSVSLPLWGAHQVENCRTALAVLGFVLFGGVVLIIANLVVDVLYAYIDPRIRLTARKGSRP